MASSRSRRVASGITALALVMTVAACSDTGPTPDERAVCGSLQTIIDGLNQHDNAKALGELGLLQLHVGKTTNTTLAQAGKAFFDVVGATGIDYTQLTVGQTIAAGNAALAQAAPALGRLIDGCAAAGLKIEGLPTAPRPG